jgi:hypothetical protein
VVGLDAKGQTQAALRTQGGWLVRGGSGQVLGALSVNADADAGSVQVRSREQVAKWLLPTGSPVKWIESGDAGAVPGAGETASAGAGSVLGDAPPPPPVSLPLLIAAALVGVFELFAARWFSHAHQDAFMGASAAGAASGANRAAGRKGAANAS